MKASRSLRYLIAVLDGPMTLANPRYASNRYSDDVTSAELLPQGNYELRIDLVGGDHGEFHETFWFKVAAGEAITITKTQSATATLMKCDRRTISPKHELS